MPGTRGYDIAAAMSRLSSRRSARAAGGRRLVPDVPFPRIASAGERPSRDRRTTFENGRTSHRPAGAEPPRPSARESFFVGILLQRRLGLDDYKASTCAEVKCRASSAASQGCSEIGAHLASQRAKVAH